MGYKKLVSIDEEISNDRHAEWPPSFKWKKSNDVIASKLPDERVIANPAFITLEIKYNAICGMKQSPNEFFFEGNHGYYLGIASNCGNDCVAIAKTSTRSFRNDGIIGHHCNLLRHVSTSKPIIS